jgi:hypothetical protein
VSPRTFLLLPLLRLVVILFRLGLLVQCVFDICLVCLLAQRRQVCVVAYRNGQAHSSQHRVLLSLLQLALLFFDARCLGFFGFFVAFCIPVQVASLLPATNGRHERVAEIVFALCIVLDVFPFEVGATAAAQC